MELLVFVELFLQVLQVGLHVQQSVAVPNRCNVSLHSTNFSSGFVLNSDNFSHYKNAKKAISHIFMG